MKSVCSPSVKPLYLHNGPLHGSIVSQTPTLNICFGDIWYRFREEDKEYYHYEHMTTVADQLPQGNEMKEGGEE